MVALRRLIRTVVGLAPIVGLASSAPPAISQTAGSLRHVTAGSLRHVTANATIPTGRGEQIAELNAIPIQVFTYKPDGCAISAILLVFHGEGRDAGPYRDHAIPLGQRFCMLVVAPYFDKVRFPVWRYQRGGIAHDGAVLPKADWTVDLVPTLAGWARDREGQPYLPYVLIGHSAGGQFLSRVAAFGQGGALRIVIANPSTWVEPTLNVAAPYGFGGVFEAAQGEVALRRYLAAPITILLGDKDTGSDELSMTEQAQAQGVTRLDRGRKTFQKAKVTAQQHGWVFNWRLAIVPGVDHDATRMFKSTVAFNALEPVAKQARGR